jgi:hypothetical protein
MRNQRDGHFERLAGAFVDAVDQEAGRGPIPDHWREPMRYWFLAAILLDPNKPPATLRTSLPSNPSAGT